MALDLARAESDRRLIVSSCSCSLCVAAAATRAWMSRSYGPTMAS